MFIWLSSKERQSSPMTSDASGTADPADLLALARTVEQCVPADIETARTCLRSLSDAIGAQQEQPENVVSQRTSMGPDDADRLRSLIARIAHDLEGGHVLAVSGLERQLKHSLEQASVATTTLLA
jgi:hypothetical protein